MVRSLFHELKSVSIFHCRWYSDALRCTCNIYQIHARYFRETCVRHLHVKNVHLFTHILYVKTGVKSTYSCNSIIPNEPRARTRAPLFKATMISNFHRHDPAEITRVSRTVAYQLRSERSADNWATVPRFRIEASAAISVVRCNMQMSRRKPRLFFFLLS